MRILQNLLILILITSFLCLAPINATGSAAPLMEVSTQDLINLINGMRVGQGLPALEVNSILMATAQQTSDTMAVSDLHWHIGGVSERIQAAGYGGGAKVWATENFAIGPMTIERIQQVWADESHMLPVVNPAYTHIGAGVTEYNGRIWYIVHAAYISGGSSYIAPTSESQPGVVVTPTPPVSQIMIPVQTATPHPGGAVIHEVKSGQSLWSIAIAYDTKIVELVRLNNLSGDTPTIYTGQKLLVVAGEVTATPNPNITETIVEPTVTQTLTALAASPTNIPATATSTPTLTATPQTETSLLETEIITPAAKNMDSSAKNLIFNNKTVGILLVGGLALGLLLIITGSIHKPKN